MTWAVSSISTRRPRRSWARRKRSGSQASIVSDLSRVIDVTNT